MKLTIGCLLIVASLTASTAQAQFGVPWRHTPSIVVIGAEGDPRVRLVDEAVAFWNKTLEEIGSAFRLGPVTHMVQPAPEEALQSLSRSIVGVGPRASVDIPRALKDLPGDLTILLGESDLCPLPALSSRRTRSASWGFAGKTFPR